MTRKFVKRSIFLGTIIKDIRTINGGVEIGGRWGGLECWAGVGGKGRKLYLNNNVKNKLINLKSKKYI